jgi:hypothetical protein
MTVSSMTRARAVHLLVTGLLVVGAPPLVSASLTSADGTPQHDDAPATLGLIGDYLYNADQVDDAERMLASVDDADLDLVVHDGDTTYAPVPDFRCSQDVLQYHADRLNALDTPVLYTPGDNEWTDCPSYVESFGAENLGYTDPLVALESVRETFFADSRSLGADKIDLAVQSEAYPENRRTTVAGVPIATLHVVGSLNGYEQVGLAPQLAQEIPARQAANLAWLRETFAEADRTGAPGVMLVMQANPDPYAQGFWEADVSAERPPLWDDAYGELLATLRTEVVEFGKPVVLVHGDTHFQRIDGPLAVAPDESFAIPGFTRVETFGTPNLNWVRATIDPTDPEVFSFERVFVPGNERPPAETR